MKIDLVGGKSAAKYEKTVLRAWKFGKNLLLSRVRGISGING
jgi:hypothetical protein